MHVEIFDPKPHGKSSFKKLMEYIAGIGHEGKARFTGSRNLMETELDKQIREMEAIADLNNHANVIDKIHHVVLSFRDNEQPTKEQIDEAVDIYLQGMGLGDCAAYYGVHQNTNNIHIDLCVNRVNPWTCKVIDEGDGWKKVTGEYLGRVIEMKQGWEFNDTGRFTLDENGQIVSKVSSEASIRISKKGQQIETKLGTKSPQRLAIEKGKKLAKNILRNAYSWANLHEELQKVNITLEKKGSGGQLIIDGLKINLSKVDQASSMSKLVKRLGPFVEHEHTVKEQEKTAPNVKEYAPVANNPLLSDYLAQLKTYNDDRSKAYQDLRETIKTERQIIKKKQREERYALYKNRGQKRRTREELNAQRVLLAKKQNEEYEQLVAEQIKRRKELKKSFLGFPSYEEWLRYRMEKDREADLWRYRRSVIGIIEGTIYIEPVTTVMMNFSAVRRRTKRGNLVVDFLNSKNEVSFIDQGKNVSIIDWHDKEAVLAALKLSAQKWGSVHIEGTEEFKNICVELAAQHWIKLDNADLRKRVEEIQEEQKNKREENRVVLDRKKLFDRYHAAVGADRYRVTVIKDVKTKNVRPYIFGEQKGSSIGLTPEQVRYQMSRLVDIDDKKGSNVYYTPIGDKVHHLIVDDVSLENLRRLSYDGYKPSVMLETSPENYQVVINVPKLGLDPEMERQVANALIRRLNKEYGDPNFSGAIHPHRAPGFHNRKEKHQREDGTFPEVKLHAAEYRECGKCVEEMKKIHEEFLKTEKEKAAITQKTMAAEKVQSPLDAYMIHAQNVIEKQGRNNLSVVDSMVAIRMAVTGYSVSEIQSAIEQGAPMIRSEDAKNSHIWPDYARRTAEYVNKPGGVQQQIKYAQYKDFWLRLEGRTEEIQEKGQVRD